MTEHNAPDIPVRPVRMAKSRAEKAKFIEIAPGKHIEASVSMRKLEKRIVRLCAMACTDYGMIEDGDKIAVAMSGGKDSYVLLDALLKLKARAPVHFDIIAVHVNQHIPGSPTHLLEAWLKEKGVTYHIENQDTYSITQKLIPSGKNVCSLCARLRRGHLYKKAQELGCNKIALGHHFNDVIETTVLSMFYGSQLQAMPPMLHSTSFPGMTLIRPMYCIREEDILAWKRYNELEFIQCACRFTENCTMCDNGGGGSKRQETKILLRRLKRDNPNIENSIFRSIHAVSLDTMPGYKSEGGEHSFLERFDRIEEELKNARE